MHLDGQMAFWHPRHRLLPICRLSPLFLLVGGDFKADREGPAAYAAIAPYLPNALVPELPARGAGRVCKDG